MVKNNILDEMAEKLKNGSKQTDKQKRIVEAAIKCFAEKGYSNTSTSEVAKIAGVAEGTIFKHYGTKENLLLSLMVPFIRDFFPAMADELIGETLNDTVSFEEFLRAILKNRIAFFSVNREIFQVFIKEIIYREELKNELLPYLYERASSRLTQIIEHFKERGEIVNISNMAILNLLGTIIGGFIISRFVLLNQQFISDNEIEDLIDFVINGIGRNSKVD